MSNLVDKSCKEFAEALASKQSVPGGGGACGLCGALAVALGSMVGEFTVGKKKYADAWDEITALLKESDEIRLRLIELVDEDAKAFEPLSVAYSIPKDDPNREAKLESATKEAIKAPVEIVHLCKRVIEILRIMQTKGSVLLLSDAGCGATMAKAAMQSAALNVYINTKSLVDRDYAKKIEDDIDSIMKESFPLADTIVSEVEKQLRGE